MKEAKSLLCMPKEQSIGVGNNFSINLIVKIHNTGANSATSLFNSYLNRSSLRHVLLQKIVILYNILIGKLFLYTPNPLFLCRYKTGSLIDCSTGSSIKHSKLCICTVSTGYGALKIVVPEEIVSQKYKMGLEAHEEEVKRLEPLLYLLTTYFLENNLSPPHVLVLCRTKYMQVGSLPKNVRSLAV